MVASNTLGRTKPNQTLLRQERLHPETLAHSSRPSWTQGGTPLPPPGASPTALHSPAHDSGKATGSLPEAPLCSGDAASPNTLQTHKGRGSRGIRPQPSMSHCRSPTLGDPHPTPPCPPRDMTSGVHAPRWIALHIRNPK